MNFFNQLCKFISKLAEREVSSKCLIGKFDEAIELAEKFKKISRVFWGNEHPIVATSLNNLAISYNYQGKYSEAEP
ncbi:tetratricopeptide repeat protein, partial [Microcoleus sp. N3A4]|uniref:tetratricopeptide repeat protein n=1 Tax=Microcoleus sp. N3A4 TaxID=3055379 RepID=UPI002FD700F8